MQKDDTTTPEDLELVEAEVIEPVHQDVLEEPSFDGTQTLGAMTEGDFNEKLQQLVDGQRRVELIKTTLMIEDVHFGTIPGTAKPSLWQPGAQLLGMIFGLRASFVMETKYGDGTSSPAVHVRSLCRLHLGSIEGPIVGTGNGTANTWERKHRYRRGNRSCPECGVQGAIIRAKYGLKGWLCYDRKGGCGAEWEQADPAIVGQQTGDVENEDQHDLDNTVTKVAEKRAFVGAILRTTASSGSFTQDTEPGDGPEDDGGRPGASPYSGRGRPSGPTDQPPIEHPRANGQAPGDRANGPGDVLEVKELYEVVAMFPTDREQTINKSQQGRLYNLAGRNGWDNTGVDGRIARVLSMQTSEIPSLGDGYEATVRWFQTHGPTN